MAFLETSTLETEIDIIEQQQHFCDLFGHPTSIIYDCYTTKESLAQKIELILPQKNESERNELTATIWHQNRYNGGHSLFMSPIFVTLVLDHKPSLSRTAQIHSKSFQVHTVFRVQKCKAGSDGANCCSIFVDESGRVYSNWTDFRTNNVYEDGLVVAPINGVYVTSDDRVKLELFERKAGITKTLDRSSLVIGLTSAGIAALTFIPALTVAPVVAVGAATAGLSCAVYTGCRGIYNLYDRKKHKQTIKLTNAEARSSWINVAAGAFSASAASAAQMLAKAAHNGAGMTNIIRTTAHALSAGALGLHTTGCLDDIYLMITRMHAFENMSTMEISHLSALLYLLTHSLKNQHAAEKMITLSQACELVDLKSILRNSQKMALNELVHRTMMVQGGATNGQMITVRSLKNHIDQQPTLMELDNENHEQHGGSDDKADVRRETIRQEYLEMFESRVAFMVRNVFSSFKTRSENELKLFLINVMRAVSMHLFDDFMAMVEQMIEKYGTMAEDRSHNVITFEHLAIMILKRLNVISQDSNLTDLNEYLEGLTEAERIKIDERIREYFDHLTDEHVQNANDLLAAHIDIAEDEKIAIAIDGEVERVIRELDEALHHHYVKDDLRETVKDVLLSMPVAASQKFFRIVTKFTKENASEIQSRLGRYIPIDIFMTDIYRMLKKISVNCGLELEQYLLDYSESAEYGNIKMEICQFYDDQSTVGDLSKCSHCTGFYHVTAKETQKV